LYEAARNGDLQAVKNLIAAGHHPLDQLTTNGKGSFPLLIAIQRGYFEIVKLLIENGANIEQEIRWNYSSLCSLCSKKVGIC
jgi:ankyrin repeat protein